MDRFIGAGPKTGTVARLRLDRHRRVTVRASFAEAQNVFAHPEIAPFASWAFSKTAACAAFGTPRTP